MEQTLTCGCKIITADHDPTNDGTTGIAESYTIPCEGHRMHFLTEYAPYGICDNCKQPLPGPDACAHQCSIIIDDGGTANCAGAQTDVTIGVMDYC